MQWIHSEFSIVEYDWFDSIQKYVVHVSDRTDPLEFTVDEMKLFLNGLRRKDGVPVPAFEEDATKIGDSPRHAHKPKPAVPAAPSPVNIEVRKQNVTIPTGAFVHVESLVKIYITNNYGIFSHVAGNRPLNKTKIKKIKDEILAGTNLLKLCPIVVVEQEGKLKVIDGQHRLEVAKQIGSYVWYVISDALTLYQIAKMNSNTEKWTGKDFINCYVQSGNINYQKLKDFSTAYGFPLTVNLQLLSTGLKLNDGSGDIITTSFQGRALCSKDRSCRDRDRICSVPVQGIPPP